MSNDLDNYNKILSNYLKIYSSREAIRSQLSEFAQEYLELKSVDLYKTSFLSYIIDMMSILTANQMFYMSTIYKEFFFITASFNESVTNLANWIGYKAPLATPSSVDVLFTIPLTFSSPAVTFIIPSDFKVYAGEVPFLIDSNPTSTYGAMFRREVDETGKPKTITTVTTESTSVLIINNNAITIRDSNGFYRPVSIDSDTKNASFILPFTQHEKHITQFIIPQNLEFYQFYSKKLKFTGMISSIKVYVQEPQSGEVLTIQDEKKYDISLFEEWSESESGLYTLTSVSKQFVWTSTIGHGELFFGNGVLGRQPSPGSKILIIMYLTSGEEGRIIPSSINRGDQLYYQTVNYQGDVQSVTTKLQRVNYKITNPAPSTGGSNTPTLPEIKQAAITNLRSKSRLVSEIDYDDINVIMGSTFPVIESVPILKRSDIKVNEIVAFMRLLYHDANNLPEIVPIRNSSINITNAIYNNGEFTIARKHSVVIDGEQYETIFNITVDQRSKVAYYDYVLSQLNNSPATLSLDQPYNESQLYIAQSYIPITTIDYSVPIEGSSSVSSSSASTSNTYSDELKEYPLIITINVNHIPSTEISFFRVKVTTRWDNNTEYIGDETVVPEIDFTTDVNITYSHFTLAISDYRTVPLGMQRIEFEIQGLIFDEEIGTDTWVPLKRYYSDVIIRQDLSDFMISTVTETRFWDGVCHDDVRTVIHNVPVILASYLDDGNGGGILNSENQQDFELVVIQNLISNLDLQSKRMLTDFINIKMPDTYGPFINLKYNPYRYEVQSRYYTPFGFTGPDTTYKKSEFVVELTGFDPDPNGEYYNTNVLYNGEYVYHQKNGLYSIFFSGYNWILGTEVSSANNGYKWIGGSTIDGSYNPTTTIDYTTIGIPIITSYELTIEPGTKYIINVIDPEDLVINKSEYIGWIAERTETNSWRVIEPYRDLYVKVLDEYDVSESNVILSHTGKTWIDVQNFNIPLEIHAKVRVNNSISSSNETLIENIKTALLEHFISSFGMDKNIDRSEIIKVIRSVEGIEYCDLLKPEIDIILNYKLKDLTQKQILDYTPEYIGFTENSIKIDVVR
jgi:hypothetical protein